MEKTVLAKQWMGYYLCQTALKTAIPFKREKDIADNFTLQLNDKKGKVEMDLEATNDLIDADEVHFPNLINNLVDNSVKYSKDNVPPEIKISTLANGRNIPAAEALNNLIKWMDEKELDHLTAKTQIIIAPGYQFKIVNGLITNFHQPQSTLLLLVAAFIGKDWRNVYDYALENNFRFLSYGDGSLLWRDS